MSIFAGAVHGDLIMDGNKFFPVLDKAQQQVDAFQKKLEASGARMQKVGSNMTRAVTLPILGAGVAAFKLASDMEEAINKVEVAFGSSADTVKTWSDSTLTNFGIAKGTALDMAALYGDMATSMQIPTEEAANMSTALVGLAGDLASFKNIGIDQAENALKAIFTGETESLKNLGIVMTQTNLEAFALAEGFSKTVSEMTEAEKVQLRYEYVLSRTKNAQGDFSRTNEGAANQMRIFTESLKELGATFGERILPILTPFIKKANEMLKTFSDLDEKTQSNIFKFLGFAAAAGPVLSITGKLTSGVGSLIGIYGKLGGKALATSTVLGKAATTAASVGTSAAGAAGAAGVTGLSSALGGAALAAAPWVAAAALVVGGGYLIHKQMSKETIPTVDLFADKIETTTRQVETQYGTMLQVVEKGNIKISDSTKEAVQAYLDLDESTNRTLHSLYINSTKITEDTVTQMTEQYNSMNEQIIKGMEEQHAKRYGQMETFFADSEALSASAEQRALESLNKYNEEQIRITTEGTVRIQEILTQASKENRALTKAEQQEINGIQNEMKNNAVTVLSETEVESKIILERLKGYAERITAEQATEVIKNAEDMRVKGVDEAETLYEETVANIIRMRDETGAISERQADTLITEATRQKDESILKAEELKNGVIRKLEEMNPEISKNVNLQTGTIKTGWDKLKDWWDGLFFAPKNTSVTTRYNSVYQTTGARPATGQTPGFSRGTENFRGGLAWVGEQGRELVELPAGSKVFSNSKSERLAGGKMELTGTVRVEAVNDEGLLWKVEELIIDRIREGALA